MPCCCIRVFSADAPLITRNKARHSRISLETQSEVRLCALSEDHDNYGANMADIRVFTARAIHTMDPSLPTATAIATRDGRIVEVGTLDSLQPWLRHHEHTIDRTFESAVIMPGFIDPHVHPAMMALLMAAEWLTPEAWELPGRSIPATSGRDAYLAGVRELHEARTDPKRPLVVYGYHAQYHGVLHRRDLDAISDERPIVIWQRSFHELWCNRAGLTWLDADEGAAWDPHIRIDEGRLFESGMAWGLKVLAPFLMGEGQLEEQLRAFRTVVHEGGVTSVADAGYGIFDFEMELDAFAAEIDRPDTPFRLYLMPNILSAKGRFKDDVFERLNELAQRPFDRITFLNAAKFLADGAFIAQLMQLGPPGYIDGHDGAWLSDPERLMKLIRPWWNAGYDINIHVNGDLGVESALDAISTLLQEHPRFDHRSTLHHFGISTQAQCRRLAALGVAVQANGYFLHQFADLFVDEWLGTERAAQITRLGSAARWGASVAVHSDTPMGPVLPMLAASAIATRTTRTGVAMGDHEALTPIDALRAITIEPAWQLRRDHEIGSLAAGKMADMTILDADPLDLSPTDWPDIPILGSIVNGVVHPLA